MRMMVRRCLSVVLCYVEESATEGVAAVLSSWLAVAASAVAGMVVVEVLSLAALC